MIAICVYGQEKGFSKNLLTDEGKSQLYGTTFDVKEVDRLQQLYENSSFQILKKDLFKPNLNVIQQVSTSIDKGHQWHGNTTFKKPLSFQIRDAILSLPTDFHIHENNLNCLFQILKDELFQPNANVIQQVSTSTDKGHQWHGNTTLKKKNLPLPNS
ncbi:hypothetical protein CDAR_578731 [Caerostris darwini]|uniref:LAGLIDADG homing endonuclease n=1 Tax=Caerostris darwini TaxID=1538125 RepID=A0AAV4UBX0_9ARAC|nr:hypothetical protein CDAR_578731 [Caerostris darwini]